MRHNHIIEFERFHQPEPFDFSAYNKRAQERFRNSEIRAWITHIVDTAVTAVIGVCVIFSMYLAILML